MQISRKERKMLLICGAVLAVFLYWIIGYKNLDKLVASTKAKKTEIENKYTSAVDTINNKSNQESRLKVLITKSDDLSKPLYPVISQEHIITELSTLFKDSNVTGSMSFDEPKLGTPVLKKESEKGVDIHGSTLQPIIDTYNAKYDPERLRDSASIKTNAQSQQQENENNSTASNSSASNSSEATTLPNNENDPIPVTPEVVGLEFGIKIYGEYKDVIKFIHELDTREKKILLGSLTISPEGENKVTADMGATAVAVPKIGAEEENYLKWNYKGSYGKSEPFAENSAVLQTEPGSTADFGIAVRGVSAELPTVVAGRPEDNLNNTAVYADSNGIEEITLELTLQDSKYYYKYKTANGSVPQDYSGVGNPFDPVSSNIIINVQSEKRYSEDDRSGAKLKIINNTDKNVEVNVFDDDPEPRFSVEGDTQISVNEK